MGDLRLLLLLPLSLAAFHGVKGCLECDPKFVEDVDTLLSELVPPDVPDRAQVLARQSKEMIRVSFDVSHSDKKLRVLAVQKVVSLRKWLKNELHKLDNETWKGVFILQGKLLKIRRNLESKVKTSLRNFSEVACSEDCIVVEGPILDCWTCLRMTTRCFKGEYCGDEDVRMAESKEISLFLTLLSIIVMLGCLVLLHYICVLHRMNMLVVRKSLKEYLKDKVEDILRRIDGKEHSVTIPRANISTQTGNLRF
ncbi:izumo sperm-egg fusion protein 3-like [Nycticebus coucang]|uniref:izumo sperm-egg fusion protein 3-like n=1 Tax=Nycticebus coucang TaxID=9470 RepID=UPI00234DDB73|nr:izumo sperm-egg fusion protein 3-like [Nycticebus coucang]